MDKTNITDINKYKKKKKVDPALKQELAETENLEKIPFKLNSYDKISTTSPMNVLLLLKYDENLKDVFKFNEFTEEVEVTKDADLPTDIGIDIHIIKGRYTDEVISQIALYFESGKRQLTFKNNIVDTGIEGWAMQNRYNPVIDYFEDAYKKWDKKPRIDRFFVDFLGAKNTEATRIISRLFFKGVVAKAYNPKTKFDYVPEFVGGQGVGKTTCMIKIAPLDLYADQFTSFTNKDDIEVMRGALIVNDDEMTASNASSFEEVKKFITTNEFAYRKAYGRKVAYFDKKFILVRTTNEVRHLKDKSGDRRFLPIFADKDKQTKSPIEDLTDDLKLQLWGEAVALFKEKESFKLTADEEKILSDNRNDFRYTTGLEDELMDILENKFKDAEFITNKDLAFALFDDVGALSRNSKETREIRYYMEHLNYKVGATKKIKGKIERGFKRLQ